MIGATVTFILITLLWDRFNSAKQKEKALTVEQAMKITNTKNEFVQNELEQLAKKSEEDAKILAEMKEQYDAYRQRTLERERVFKEIIKRLQESKSNEEVREEVDNLNKAVNEQ